MNNVIKNDFVITVATANGSGSQSSNNVLVRALFRMGIPVGGKNLFPSNIQGLPTWFTIRANDEGYTSRKRLADVVVAMNAATAVEDLKLLRPGGFLILNSEIKLTESQLRADVKTISVPFKDLISGVTESVKLKKLLVNMAYAGVIAELSQIPETILNEVVAHQFGDKDSVIETNQKAIAAGRTYVREQLKGLEFPFRAEARLEPHRNANLDKILIDGNTATSIGMLYGGCTVVAWYPITPSSSVVESFQELANKYRVDANGKKNFAIVQAEDELASIAMVVGAGWAGARAMTATSGPGLSLMAEAAGIAYYAEIPAVIWDVQRVGPSTGLPTRTMQGDLLSAYYLSHGDTKHVVLFPNSPAECFEFAQTAFDLAERLQTLVIVLSDLDIGMNLHRTPRFKYPERPFDRGKVLSASDLQKAGKFQRYKDMDGDGICARTVTGTAHPLAAYFTRGTGHNEAGLYSEKSDDFKANMDRLQLKFETAKTLVPKPIIEQSASPAKIGFITFGSSYEASVEARDFLRKHRGLESDSLRIRALPFSAEVETFIQQHDQVFVIEQNRDAQLMSILRAELPALSKKCSSILHYDGLPLDAESIIEQTIAYLPRLSKESLTL